MNLCAIYWRCTAVILVLLFSISASAMLYIVLQNQVTTALYF